MKLKVRTSLFVNILIVSCIQNITDCINGLPDSTRRVQPCRQRQPPRRPCTGPISPGRTYVFPAVTINCAGTLKKLTVNGERSIMISGDKRPTIQVWRMRGNFSGLYTLKYYIPLNSQCCSTRGSKAICTTSFRVMAGDTIGVHLPSPRNYFLLYSNTAGAYCLPKRAKNFKVKNSSKCLENVLPPISMRILPGRHFSYSCINFTLFYFSSQIHK